ncbi:MAG: hypothetical protein GTO17_13435 [Candidatus Aminicenantes bacterium]|nr:hypothetical protein [Candidatus Aminicenantes bacterium]
MNRKTRKLIVTSLVVLLLISASIVLKNILLNQVKNRIQDTFNYAQLRLSLFPPALIVEDVRTISPSPFFSAKEVSFRISFRSLLSRERPLKVFMDEPVLIIHASAPSEEKKGKASSLFPLPFALERVLIRRGEFYFWGKQSHFQSTGIRALFIQRKNYLSIQGETEESSYAADSLRQELRGKIHLLLEGPSDQLKIKKLRIYDPGMILKAEGDLSNLQDPEIRLETSFKINTSLIADYLNLPFEWDGKSDGQGILERKERKVSFSSSLSSNDLVLNGVPLGKVRGKVEAGGGVGGRIEFNIQRGLFPEEYLKIDFNKKRIVGLARGLHLDPIMKFLKLPWPSNSPAWGNFTLDRERLEVEVEFRDEPLKVEPDRFPFQGPVRLTWNLKDEVALSSPRLLSNFALVDVEGKIRIRKDIDITIQGEVSDVRQARQFTSLILDKNFAFPEIRGGGRADLHIFGDYFYPRVKANFTFSPGGFDRFQVNLVEGEAKILRSDFTGKFKVKDPFMEGEIDLFSNQEGLKANIRLEEGDVERILPSLNIPFPLHGRASGNFQLQLKGDNLRLDGEFTSPLMKVSTQTLEGVEGRLGWDGNVLTFQELQFRAYGGSVKGYSQIGFRAQEFDLDVVGESLDLTSLSPALEGNLSFRLKGGGSFDQDVASGDIGIIGFHISPLQKSDVKGKMKVGFKRDKLLLDIEGNFFPGENEFFVSLALPFGQGFTGNIRGGFQNLDLLLPWHGAKGQINYLAELNGTKTAPQLKGIIDFKGSVLPFPKFAHAFRDYSGLIFVENNNLSLRSFKGLLGGGDIWGTGSIKVGKQGIEYANLEMDGKDLLLSPLERTRVLADGSLNLLKDSQRFILEGDFDVHRLSWRRELNEKFVFSSSPYYQSQTEAGIFDDLTLNIRLQAKENSLMENSLGRIEGKFDLTVTGNVKAPILTGAIDALGGNVYFQDRKFRILRARVSFINPLVIEPYLEFEGETYVKDYHVTFSLNGSLDSLKPEFRSSPPLPPEDVLALLAMGEAFKRTYSYEKSTQLSTASLLSFQLAEEAKKRAEKLFRIDRFRIDPFVMESSAETTARLTVGKMISRNFTLLYSTNLSTQREELVRLEWELTDDLSVVGIRDEQGRLSIDVKIHKRF